MSYYLDKIKYHYLAILVGFVFTVAILSPRILNFLVINKDFQGVYPALIEDEVHYESRISDVTRGNWGLGNPYIKEYEDSYFVQPPISEWAIALFSIVTSLSVPLSIFVTSFIIIPIFFILTYLLFFKITRNKLLSIVFGSFFFLIFFQTFGRPVSPQLHMLFFLPGLIFIYDVYFGGSNLKHFLAGIFTGLCLFVSPYYWTTLLCLYVLVIISNIYFESERKLYLKKLIYFGYGFVPLGLIYGLFVFKVSRLDIYQEVITRFGMIYSRWPGSYSNIFFGLMSVLVVISLYKTVPKKNLILASIFTVSIFLLNWQNVITNQALQFPSHYLVITILFTLFVLALAVKELTERFDLKNKRLVILLSLVVLTFALLSYRQRMEYTIWVPKVSTRADLTVLQEKQKVFTWFNKNTETGSVVYVLGSDLGQPLTIYTNNKVFYDNYAALYLISDEEVIDRWLIQNIFVPNVGVEYITSNQKDFFWNRYVDSYFFNMNKSKIWSLLGIKKDFNEKMVPEEIVLPIASQNDRLRGLSKKEVLSKYKLDYILLSKQYKFYDHALEELSKLDFLTLVETIDGNKIYRVD